MPVCCRFPETGKVARFDFYVENRYLIEFDGEQHINKNNTWYNETLHKHDLMKNNYAKCHNIPLIRIPYSKKDSLTLEDLLGDSYLI